MNPAATPVRRLPEDVQQQSPGATSVSATGMRASRWQLRAGRGLSPRYCAFNRSILQARTGDAAADVVADRFRPKKTLGHGGSNDRPQHRPRPSEGFRARLPPARASDLGGLCEPRDNAPHLTEPDGHIDGTGRGSRAVSDQRRLRHRRGPSPPRRRSPLQCLERHGRRLSGGATDRHRRRDHHQAGEG